MQPPHSVMHSSMENILKWMMYAVFFFRWVKINRGHFMKNFIRQLQIELNQQMSFLQEKVSRHFCWVVYLFENLISNRCMKKLWQTKIKARWRTISTTFRWPVNEEIDIFFLLMGPIRTLLIFLSSLRQRGCVFLRQHTFIQVWPCSIFLLPFKLYCFF